ncbi:MAG: flavin oxidoreductase/NADH oxidase [Clostridia bacterium]|nr:flavin oxidoreductase/NADH oxidase [Clostridia bacterium]
MGYGFPYKNGEDLRRDAWVHGVTLPWAEDVSILKKPVSGNGFVLPNPLTVQPMEGCDSTPDGAPTDWTVRRYRRYAAGGAGLIWVEAVAVTKEGRANPRQLMITEENLPSFVNLRKEIEKAAMDAGLPKPVVVVQLTHSGRWSRPVDRPAPIRAWTSRPLDEKQGDVGRTAPIIMDEDLERLPEMYARAARLCTEAGFDGVDVKASHLYLLSELLGAKDRLGPNGGSYENRTRIFLQCVKACRGMAGILASRINLFDGTAGKWGEDAAGSMDLTEPLRLCRDLRDDGVTLLNLTMGTPYYNPHVNRPFATGEYEAPEAPVVGVARLLEGCRRAQKEVEDVVCVATGFSYLRQFAPYVAAGLLEEKGAMAVGFGRMSFAYPDFANDILKSSRMFREKSCVACGLCTKIMRAGGRPGCPVRDTEWYLPEYRAYVKEKEGKKA